MRLARITGPSRLARTTDPAALFALQKGANTQHLLVLGDARDMRWLPKNSVHLVLTSPPYWKIKDYGKHRGQLGRIGDYDDFLRELDKVWRECFRVIVPGGRLVCVVGDICISRHTAGRHHVIPLHADLQMSFRRIGFDNLSPIFWHKIANGSHEVENGVHFYGKPYEPNAVIKNETEYVLVQRKPGAYRSPTPEQRMKSFIPRSVLGTWFAQIWRIPGESSKVHPAPFPLELARRLIRMYSFCGDLVLDPFAGTGTTVVASMECGRDSVGIEIVDSFFEAACTRASAQRDLCAGAELRAARSADSARRAARVVCQAA